MEIQNGSDTMNSGVTGTDEPRRQLRRMRERDEACSRKLLEVARDIVYDLLASEAETPESTARRLYQARQTLEYMGRLATVFARPSPPLDQPKSSSIMLGDSMVLGALSAEEDEVPSMTMSTNPLGVPASGPGTNLLTGQLAETFGAKTIEELVAALPRIVSRFRISDQVSAIVAAKNGGLTSLADELEERLKADLGMKRTVPASSSATNSEPE